MRWLRKSWVHFVVIGAALFALQRYAPLRTPGRPTVVISAARLADLESNARRSGGAADHAAILEQAIEEEVLYREALARGLDRGDQSIHWQMSEKMRFLTEGDRAGTDAAHGIDAGLYQQAVALGLDRDDPLVRGLLVEKMRLLLKRAPSETPPDDQQLQAYLDRHADRFMQPARVTLDHVFLAPERRGTSLDADARQLLERLRVRASSASEAVRLGDPFPMGVHLRGQSEQDLARIFGTGFAAAVLALEPDTWAGPVRSPFGVHLVRVAEKQPARPLGLQEVRSRVRAQLLEAQQMTRLANEMQMLRGRYAIRVETAPGAQG